MYAQAGHWAQPTSGRSQTPPLKLLGALLLCAFALVLFRNAAVADHAETFDPADAVTFLTPLSGDSAGDNELDPSLTNSLEFRILRNGAEVDSLTDQDRGAQRLRLQGDGFYMSVFKPAKGTGGVVHEIQVLAGGLLIDSMEVMVMGSQSIPIKVHIQDHPVIRIAVLQAMGQTATQIAVVIY